MPTETPPSTTNGHELIDSLATTLDLGDSTEQVARVIFQQTTDQRNGRSLTIIASASIYLACKQNNRPTDATTICTDQEFDSNRLLQMAKTLDSELSLGTNLFNPDTYVSNYCNHLDLSTEAEDLAQKIVTATTEEGVASGRSPTGFAAAAVYYASILANEKRTQREVSNVADVSEVTIRNTYHDQADCIGDRLNGVM
jgi:transcription initiation factor TFIIB